MCIDHSCHLVPNTLPSRPSLFFPCFRSGQSLVVWAIAEGRGAADNVDKFLMGDVGAKAVGLKGSLQLAPAMRKPEEGPE